MFGNGNGKGMNGFGGAVAARPQMGARVYTPRHPVPDQATAPEEAPAPYRVTVPQAMKEPAYDKSFFAKYPQSSWEAWSRRVEMEWLTVARGMDSVVYGTIGALVGLAISAAPGAFQVDYPYVVWQPVGAAVGAISGLVLAWRHWRGIFRAHEGLR